MLRERAYLCKEQKMMGVLVVTGDAPGKKTYARRWWTCKFDLSEGWKINGWMDGWMELVVELDGNVARTPA